MNSLVKVFSNFKEFYSEINAATLTGAIDVVVVEQPDGSFQCSPFHVRFGKLGVLRSREKIVDIEINGEQVDIHMKLGESGEAFFVEECPEDDLDELPANMATSPLPTSEFAKYDEQKTYIVDPVAEGNELPIPRRNSIDLSKEFEEHKQLKLIENQISDYSIRRHTDTMERRDLSETKKEFTTHKIRQEWACHEDQMLAAAAAAAAGGGVTAESTAATQTSTSIEKTIPKLNENQFIPITAARTSTKDDNNNNNENNTTKKITEINTIKRTVVNTALANAAIAKAVVATNTTTAATTTTTTTINNASTIAITSNTNTKEESKSKKKRRKKSQMKKKSTLQQQQQQQQQLNQQSQMRKNSSSSSMGSPSEQNDNETDSISISNNTANGSSNEDESPKLESISSEGNTVVGKGTETIDGIAGAIGDTALTKPASTSPTKPLITSAQRIRDLDIHFFSDTDVPSGLSPRTSRPTTPIQSDSELELSMRGEKNNENQHNNSPSWKWGELPITTTSGSMATTTASYKIAGANSDATADAFGPHPDLVDDEASKQAAERNSMISNVFSFMKQSKKYRKPSKGDGGVYLSELETMEYMDPEVAALYFPPINNNNNNNKMNNDASMNMNIVSPPSSSQQQLQQQQEDDRESGNGTSLPHSPSSMEGQKSLDSDYEEGKSNDRYLDFVSMSLCGGLENGGVPSDEEFQKHIVAYSEVCRNPSIFASPSLVVRLSGKYYSWTAACPIVMTILTYQKPLSNNAVEQLMNDAKMIQDISTSTAASTTTASESLTTDPVQSESKRSWWYWRRSAGGGNGTAPGNDGKPDKQLSIDDGNGTTTMGEPIAGATQTSRSTTPLNESGTSIASGSIRIDAGSVRERNNTFSGHDNSKDYLDIKNDLNNEVAELNDKSYDELKSMEKYRKSLRLTSEQIECLNLKNGMNEIEFSVTTAYQGTSRCKCYLFRWKYNDKVVISDIDGTITKSDVLGHILPMVGRDWAQIGVAELFTKIEENGYKLLYLSARAIGQSRATREYLRSIRQGDVALPDGPLLLNPTSLISAFHREVIEKKPEEFKIACLSDIQALFPDKNPFYAGYGNRINDVWAYRAVGIPIMRIFTINPKGELKHELTQAFQSSYCSMAFIADQLFPPINDCDESVEYSNFNYWRDPVIDIDLNLNMTSTLSTTQQTQNSNNNNNNSGIIQNSNNVVGSSIGNLTGNNNLGVIGGGGGGSGITGSSGSGGGSGGIGGGINPLSNNLPSPGQHSSKLLPTIPEN